jgi:hypothetical protein
VTVINVYPNMGPLGQAIDYPWCVSIDDHEPVGLFSEKVYAEVFATMLPPEWFQEPESPTIRVHERTDVDR